ncbi:MAG: single-stranded-DNA-specific exonuclease RecJ [Parcubacteria group bacterium]|nr:single-stranded-DNA-specific exonuclease RecJ [Parcubacteria group bacterium]|tara:strand:+ start:1132 stop:2847 length:1716 start_codon:yes stop_codon:yes gene_type:complete
MDKKWHLAEKVDKDFLEKFPEINNTVLQLLHNRGISSEADIDKFLNSDYLTDLHDPFLFRDGKKAVERILKAIEGKENIVVYGDYDADGVTSTAVMVETLEALGSKAKVYIPFRETEGYGLNMEAVKGLVKEKANLVITVDCGISNVEEAEFLQKEGVDIIITDHHQEPIELPKAFAILNPNVKAETYPFRSLAGCGVAFKLCQGLIKEHQNYKVKQVDEGFEKWLLDIVAIGTIADMQPILNENRVLVKYGLVVLQKTKRLGILKLIEFMSSKLTSIDERVVGWQITPRLNAAGRLNHASAAYQLLITEDVAEAEKLANELNDTNKQRQQITEKIGLEVNEQIGEVKGQKILIAVGDGWPIGVVGLAAGRLSNKHHLPSLVISRYNGEIIGSGRSISEFNIIKALQQCDELLTRYGGHPQACGFTIKDEESLIKFRTKLEEIALAELGDQKLVPTVDIDSEIKLEEVNWDLFKQLEKFMPYGQGNNKPIFLSKDLTVSQCQTVGPEGKHLRLIVKHQTEIIRKTIGFGFGHQFGELKEGDKVDMVFEIDINEWNGNRELQLRIIDLKSSD